jgi:butyryl-CoA dehydrogenase
MTSLVLNRRDVDFMLFEWLRVQDMLLRDRFLEHSEATLREVLDLAENVATEVFAPTQQLCDQQEPTFDGERVTLPAETEAALKTLADTGLMSATADKRVGGHQLPQTLATACYAFLQAANISLASYALLTLGNARLLLEYGTSEQTEKYVMPMLSGRFFGTMCLSEPHAGSSLSDLTTRAEPQPDGTYRLFGNKMWISAGDHELGENIIHLVLARLPGAPAGVRGISLFLVPKFLLDADGNPAERNDVALAGLNHKMGCRGTTNALLNFGEGRWTPGGQPGAVGHLVGELNRGLGVMFHMMDDARISVGTGASALGYTGYLHALDYARQRRQGRPLDNRDPSSAPVAILEHPDVRRMLLAQKCYVEGALGLSLFCSRLVDDSQTHPDLGSRARARLLLNLLTPIVKSWPSQWCLEANSLAIQVHGGYGYTRDFVVEQLYRDNRLNPIHEGTHGIQAQDLLGRKVLAENGAGFHELLARIDATITLAEGQGLASFGHDLSAARHRLEDVTRQLWANGDPRAALSNATLYLEAVGHIVIAWIWLEQLLAASGQDDTFYQGKRAAAHYFFAYELPKVDAQLDLLASMQRLTLELDPACL